MVGCGGQGGGPEPRRDVLRSPAMSKDQGSLWGTLRRDPADTRVSLHTLLAISERCDQEQPSPSLSIRSIGSRLRDPFTQFRSLVSQLTDSFEATGYIRTMRQMDVYFHEGCPSEQSLFLMVKEIAHDCPTWKITLHQLLEHEAKALGFQALPAIALNGAALATGIPNKDWLLEKMKECERVKRQ